MLNKPRLLAPGPTALPENVRLAMAADIIHHRKPVFKKVMAKAQKNLQLLFGTKEVVIPLTSSGTGAMVAAVSGLFAPGEKIIVIDGGKFAERWAEIAKQHNIEAVVHKVPWGEAVKPADLEALLKKHPDLSGVCVQLCETSTGAQHPIKELAAITRKSKALLVVDGISGVGICPCPMDEWGIDCLLTGSQKGLMLPPGLAFIALSGRSWAKAETVKSYCYYFNLPAEKANILKDQTNFTPAISLLIGLNTSLEMFFETGLETIYKKQWALSCMARAGVTAMGLEPFAPTAPAWGVTCVRMPAGMSSATLLADVLKRYNITMAAGQGDLKDKTFRIGHMGWVDWADLLAALHAICIAYQNAGGHVGTRDYLEQALKAYWQALESDYPL